MKTLTTLVLCLAFSTSGFAQTQSNPTDAEVVAAVHYLKAHIKTGGSFIGAANTVTKVITAGGAAVADSSGILHLALDNGWNEQETLLFTSKVASAVTVGTGVLWVFIQIMTPDDSATDDTMNSYLQTNAGIKALLTLPEDQIVQEVNSQIVGPKTRRILMTMAKAVMDASSTNN